MESVTRLEVAIPAKGSRRAGFTLIEMLVVVLVMGLLISLVSVVSRPDARGALRIEAERLAQLMDLAASEASLTGSALAWTATETEYRFWRWRDGVGWSEIRDSEVLRERALPAGMSISGWRVENMRPQGAMRLEFAPYSPPLFFALELSYGDAQYTVASTAGGIVRAVAMDTHASPAL